LSNDIQERLNAAVAKGSLNEIKKSISHLKEQLKIPESVAKTAKTQLEETYLKAEQAICMVGGSQDDIAKMWGYNYGAVLYNHLSKRDTLEGRQALSFIKMALGYELSAYGFSEIQNASFVMGLGLRFMIGFENLKKSIGEIENKLKKIETIPKE
jgi:phage tail tape-measure protein